MTMRKHIHTLMYTAHTHIYRVSHTYTPGYQLNREFQHRFYDYKIRMYLRVPNNKIWHLGAETKAWIWSTMVFLNSYMNQIYVFFHGQLYVDYSHVSNEKEHYLFTNDERTKTVGWRVALRNLLESLFMFKLFCCVFISCSYFCSH